MDENTRKKLYAALAAPFPEACIQRTEGRLTGRGYDTTGIAYQFIVNRLNEVLGLGCFRVHREVSVREIQRSNGRPAFEAVCDLTLELGEWVGGAFVVFAESLADGGHVASSEADARKGSFTNAFKKAAAFHGVGRQAYEGSIDDDDAHEDDYPSSTQLTRTTQEGTASASDASHASRLPSGSEAPADARGSRTEQRRLSPKQLSAIWSLARKLGFEQSSFRSRVKAQHGCAVDLLYRDQASALITALDLQLRAKAGSHSETKSLAS